MASFFINLLNNTAINATLLLKTNINKQLT